PAHQIGEPVAVDVARAADRKPIEIVHRRTVEPEASIAVQAGKTDLRAEAGRSKHNIGRARIRAVWVRKASTDNEDVKTVAVDVAGTADGIAGLVVRRRTVDPEPVGAIKSCHIEERSEARRLPKNDIARASTVRRTLILGRSADNQIIDSVAVDVARAAH